MDNCKRCHACGAGMTEVLGNASPQFCLLCNRERAYLSHGYPDGVDSSCFTEKEAKKAERFHADMRLIVGYADSNAASWAVTKKRLGKWFDDVGYIEKLHAQAVDWRLNMKLFQIEGFRDHVLKGK